MKNSPILFVFGGLPGSGKSELSRHLAKITKSAYLRIDTIEQALKNVGDGLSGPEGYEVANRLALDNLLNGISVVADSVNPIAVTRNAWKKIAEESCARIIQIEVKCSNLAEHRERVENRRADLPGHILPTWAEVIGRNIEPWGDCDVIIDTAGKLPVESKKELEGLLRNSGLIHL